jgi:3-isopropylmalate/(R)-2-methylmalate dehydratase small subunit
LQCRAAHILGKDAMPEPDFVLNKPEASGVQILVAGPNFGCGSSREHAPWSLMNYGFRAVISVEIADIFRANCFKNGLLPVVVDESTSNWLIVNPGAQVTVDLESSEVRLPNGNSEYFQIDPFARYCLIQGIDEFEFLRSKLADIERHEVARRKQGCT